MSVDQTSCYIHVKDITGVSSKITITEERYAAECSLYSLQKSHLKGMKYFLLKAGAHRKFLFTPDFAGSGKMFFAGFVLVININEK